MAFDAIRQSMNDWWNAPPRPIEKAEKSDINALIPIEMQEEIEVAIDLSIFQENQLVTMYVIALKRVDGRAQWLVMKQKEVNLDQYKKYVELTVKAMQNSAWWSSTCNQWAGTFGVGFNLLAPRIAQPILKQEYKPVKMIWQYFKPGHALTPDSVKKWEKQILTGGQMGFNALQGQSQIEQSLSQGPMHEYSSKSQQFEKKVEGASGRMNEIRQDQMAIFQMLEQLMQQLSKLNEKTNQAG